MPGLNSSGHTRGGASFYKILTPPSRPGSSQVPGFAACEVGLWPTNSDEALLPLPSEGPQVAHWDSDQYLLGSRGAWDSDRKAWGSIINATVPGS